MFHDFPTCFARNGKCEREPMRRETILFPRLKTNAKRKPIKKRLEDCLLTGRGFAKTIYFYHRLNIPTGPNRLYCIFFFLNADFFLFIVRANGRVSRDNLTVLSTVRDAASTANDDGKHVLHVLSVALKWRWN